MRTESPAPRCVTSLLMGDPDPDRLARSEALRAALPEPRPDQPLSDWLMEAAREEAAA